MAGKNDISIPPFVGPRWVQINLDSIKFNVRQVKELLKPGTKLMAVVKANAYGCGAVEVSRAVLEAGADMLGVTTLDEGMELREMGIEAPILIFAPLLPGEIETVSRYSLTATAGNLHLLEILSAKGRDFPVKLHVKVDTGMNRVGLHPDEVVDFAERARKLPGVELEGLYTHLATTLKADKSFVLKQFEIFTKTVSELEKRDLQIPLKHICNSATALDMPQLHMDMVRVGTLIYGQYPFGYEKRIHLRDPWEVKARVVHIKEVPAGQSIGYGRDYRARRRTRVGIIPFGFADGFGAGPEMSPKNFLDLLKMLAKKVLSYFGIRAGTPLVKVAGTPVKVLGRIGMQLTAVDLTGLDHVNVGDTASVFLRRTGASSRLPRVFISGEEVVGIKTPAGYMRRRNEYF